jgi:ABC-type nickel/cobalt efflux system permease component RcnA
MKIKSLWQLIFILSILYSVSSMNVLVLVKSILPYLQSLRIAGDGSYFLRTHVLVYFADISFALVVFLGAYHIFNMFRSEKK